MDKIDLQLKEANERLKNSRVGVTICRIKNSLFLRATLPPKPGSSRTLPHQQTISLGSYANPAGIKHAENEARLIGALLAKHQFDWEPYLRPKPNNDATSPPTTIAEWVSQLEQDYFIRRQRTPKTETTWNGDYLKAFKKLPEDEALTSELILQAVSGTEPDSKSRKRVCMAFNTLAKFAGVEVDLKRLGGNYSPRRVSPKQIPDDEIISQCWHQIKNPGWRWVFGILATYGLRPSESFWLDLESLKAEPGILMVLDGKTGPRRVWPCYPEWRERWKLDEPLLPGVNCKNNSDYSHRVNDYFKDAGVPFSPLHLRHAWAVRTLHFGWDIALSAAQMGHSVQVHTDLYFHWIDERHHNRAFEILMNRPDRPQPPD